VEANERLGFPADLRNYGVGAQILSDLGVHRLRLITNNPRKIAGLGGYGLQVVDRVPLVMDPGQHNATYLQAKRTKLGHLMEGEAHGLTAVLAWQGGDDPQRLGLVLETLQAWAEGHGLMLERESDPRLLALLEQPDLAILLASPQGQPLSAADLAMTVQRLAEPASTRAVSLLLAPDLRRATHPSADLEPERRPFSELRTAESRSCPLPLLQPGAFVVWS
jgi:3,4-dihydroxy 2-butanone 4-phosphate synthase / GTP cyclohydrolase II